MKEFPDYKILQVCLLQIEAKLGWGKADSWPNEAFDELSSLIQENTSVLLSPTTLKRVWGKVNYQSSPSINTLNTLAQFAGHKNWLDFKNQHTISPRQRLNRSLWKPALVIAGLLILGILFLSPIALVDLGSKVKVQALPEKIHFTSRPIAEGIPNSVLFDLDLEGIDSDSMLIQQFWDPAKTIQLKQGQKQATGIYYYPGYFRAKLLVDGSVIQEHDLFIKSGGWLGTIDYDPIPKYLSTEDILSTELRLSEADVQEIASLDDPHYSSFHWVDDLTHISADNFILETEVRNVYRDKWAVCQTFKLVVLGTKGAAVIPFSIPGCVSDLGVMANDVYWSGKEHDLSSLGADFSEFRRIKLHFEGQRLKVFLDGKEVFTTEYSEEIGQLAGLRFRFLGAGEVQDLRLYESDGTLVSNDRFKPL